MATFTTTFTVQQIIARAGSGASGSFTNPTSGGLVDDVNYSQWADSSLGTRYTNWLVVSSILNGHLLPDNGIITGIQVPVKRKDLNEDDGDAGTYSDTSLIYVSTSLSSPNGTSKSSATKWPAADTAEVFGSTSDMWGQTFTGAQVKLAGFSVWLSARLVESLNTPAPAVGRIALTLTYTPPAGKPKAAHHMRLLRAA